MHYNVLADQLDCNYKYKQILNLMPATEENETELEFRMVQKTVEMWAVVR